MIYNVISDLEALWFILTLQADKSPEMGIIGKEYCTN